ncbi:hypothetical protein RFI_23634, partial [Reticulomyxa filosa]
SNENKASNPNPIPSHLLLSVNDAIALTKNEDATTQKGTNSTESTNKQQSVATDSSTSASASTQSGTSATSTIHRSKKKSTLTVPEEKEEEDETEDETKYVDPMFKDLSTVKETTPTEAIHLKKDTSSFSFFFFLLNHKKKKKKQNANLEEIRKQLLAMRTEQDEFTTAFQQSIVELKADHEEHIQRQSLIELRDASLKDEKLLKVDKLRLLENNNDNENDDDNDNGDGNNDEGDESSYSDSDFDYEEEEAQGTFIFKEDAEDEFN